VEAVRLEFYDFAEETKQALEQLREHVVAAIHTLDPGASTQEVFRAADFGMSEKEKRLRLEGFERYLQRTESDAPRPAIASEPQRPRPHDG
jgi:hypothetical protein